MAKKKEIKYLVVSKVERFRRSGIEFTQTPTILTKAEITPGILNESMLVVTELTGEEEKEDE